MPVRPYDPLEAERKMAMKRLGLAQADLARRWKRSQPFVSQLLSGKSRSRECELDFAKLVGRSHDELFGPGRPVERAGNGRRRLASV